MDTIRALWAVVWFGLGELSGRNAELCNWWSVFASLMRIAAGCRYSIIEVSPGQTFNINYRSRVQRRFLGLKALRPEFGQRHARLAKVIKIEQQYRLSIILNIGHPLLRRTHLSGAFFR